MELFVIRTPFILLHGRHFFKKHDFLFEEDDLKQNIYGKSNVQTLEYFLKRKLSASEANKLSKEKEKLFYELFKPHIRPLPGLLQFINDLKSNSIKTAIATSAPYSNVPLIPNAIPIGDKMDLVLYEKDVLLHKPHPDNSFEKGPYSDPSSNRRD